MTRAEEGILLLCCSLGDEECKPLTMPQFRELGLRVRASFRDGDQLRELSVSDLRNLNYDQAQAERILWLLDREQKLVRYLKAGEARGIYAVTRLSPAYPARVLAKRQLSAPPVLFCMGDASLLREPSVAVVGSRELRPENAAFARTAGRLAAEEDLTLVSGGAVGADTAAQEACLSHGGKAVIFLPRPLTEQTPRNNVLYCAEGGYDLPFRSWRALNRNALIHMQGERTLAAQCTYGSGGTWQGCMENLKQGWSPLFVYDDGSDGAKALMEQGAEGVRKLERISDLVSSQTSLFD